MSARKIYDKTPSGKKPTSGVKKNSKKKNPGNWLLIGLGLTGVAMLSATAGALLAVSLSVSSPLQQAKLTEQEKAVFSQDEAVSQKSLQVPELSRPVNILVMGIKVLTSDLDRTPEEDLGYHALVDSFEGLADTMLLLRFDPYKKKLTVLSIPRDTRAYIEGYGEQKINAANYHGGPALSAEAASELLDGVQIDRYIRLNVQGVEKLIDALGGVRVYVPKDMKYNDFSQHLYIDLKKGWQHLDGAKAVQFLRFRYDQYGDISRVQRQQTFMRALKEQALKPTSLVRMPEVLSVVKSHIDTNLTVKELMALAGFASQTQRSDVQMLMLPGEFNDDGTTGVSYWLPHQQEIKEIASQHFDVIDAGAGYADPEARDPSRLRVAIQDSTGDSEAVETIVHHLQEAGYERIFVGEPWQQPLQETRIVAQQGDDGSAAALRANLGLGEVLVESTGVLGSDITIQVGKDWRSLIKAEKANSDNPEKLVSF